MGAQRNIPLAGDAARRMPPSRRSGENPQVVGEQLGQSPNAIRRQEMYADRPGLTSALQTQNPSFSQGITTDPSLLGNISEGAPGRERIMERLRGMRNTGGRI
jgi:hypothetical protein